MDHTIWSNDTCICDLEQGFYGDNFKNCSRKECPKGHVLNINGICKSCSNDDWTRCQSTSRDIEPETQQAEVSLVVGVVACVIIVIAAIIIMICWKKRLRECFLKNDLNRNIIPASMYEFTEENDETQPNCISLVRSNGKVDETDSIIDLDYTYRSATLPRSGYESVNGQRLPYRCNPQQPGQIRLVSEKLCSAVPLPIRLHPQESGFSETDIAHIGESNQESGCPVIFNHSTTGYQNGVVFWPQQQPVYSPESNSDNDDNEHYSYTPNRINQFTQTGSSMQSMLSNWSTRVDVLSPYNTYHFSQNEHHVYMNSSHLDNEDTSFSSDENVNVDEETYLLKTYSESHLNMNCAEVKEVMWSRRSNSNSVDCTLLNNEARQDIIEQQICANNSEADIGGKSFPEDERSNNPARIHKTNDKIASNNLGADIDDILCQEDESSKFNNPARINEANEEIEPNNLGADIDDILCQEDESSKFNNHARINEANEEIAPNNSGEDKDGILCQEDESSKFNNHARINEANEEIAPNNLGADIDEILCQEDASSKFNNPARINEANEEIAPNNSGEDKDELDESSNLNNSARILEANEEIAPNNSGADIDEILCQVDERSNLNNPAIIHEANEEIAPVAITCSPQTAIDMLKNLQTMIARKDERLQRKIKENISLKKIVEQLTLAGKENIKLKQKIDQLTQEVQMKNQKLAEIEELLNTIANGFPVDNNSLEMAPLETQEDSVADDFVAESEQAIYYSKQIFKK